MYKPKTELKQGDKVVVLTGGFKGKHGVITNIIGHSICVVFVVIIPNYGEEVHYYRKNVLFLSRPAQARS